MPLEAPPAMPGPAQQLAPALALVRVIQQVLVLVLKQIRVLVRVIQQVLVSKHQLKLYHTNLKNNLKHHLNQLNLNLNLKNHLNQHQKWF